MVIVQGNAVDDALRRTDDPNPHALMNSKVSATLTCLITEGDGSSMSLLPVISRQRHKGFDITIKKQGRLARSESENGSVPLSIYPRRR
jgi:hypothetical protein